MSTAEYFVTGTKKRRGRGKSRKSLDLIRAAHDFLEDAHPTTVRGVCDAHFVRWHDPLGMDRGRHGGTD
jgi:hypothetical protein